MNLKIFCLTLSLLFTLPVYATNCPSPETIKPCKILVTEEMVKSTIIDQLKAYDLKKLDNHVVKEITQVINSNPKDFLSILFYYLSSNYNPLVLKIGTKLNIDVYVSDNNRQLINMLVHLRHKAKNFCIYKNANLNLISQDLFELSSSKILAFEGAFFFSKHAAQPKLGGTLTRCAYRLDNGKTFDLIDNIETVKKPRFKLNDDFKKYWTTLTEEGVYQCKGNSVLNCAFTLG